MLGKASYRALAGRIDASSRAPASDEKTPVPLTALFHLVHFNEGKVRKTIDWPRAFSHDLGRR